MSMETSKDHYDPVSEMVELFNQLETNERPCSMLKAYKEKISTQALVIRTLEEKLSHLEAETRESNRILFGQKVEIEKCNQRLADLQSEIKSPTDYTAKIRYRQSALTRLENKLARLKGQPQMCPFRSLRNLRVHILTKRIASQHKHLKADIKSNAERENATKAYKEQTAKIRDLEEKLAKLEEDTKSSNNNFEKKLAKIQLDGKSNKKTIRASQVKIGQQEDTIEQLAQSIADLKSVIAEISASHYRFEGIHLKLQSYLARQEENKKLLDSYKVQLKERNDQINLLELKRSKKNQRKR